MNEWKNTFTEVLIRAIVPPAYMYYFMYYFI